MKILVKGMEANILGEKPTYVIDHSWIYKVKYLQRGTRGWF